MAILISKIYLNFLIKTIGVFLVSSFGPGRPDATVACVQAPGGTGALRLAIDLVSHAAPGAVVHLGLPSWPNHAPMLDAAGLRIATYRHYAADAGAFLILLSELSRLCLLVTIAALGTKASPRLAAAGSGFLVTISAASLVLTAVVGGVLLVSG
jgi:hypothetical protein